MSMPSRTVSKAQPAVSVSLNRSMVAVQSLLGLWEDATKQKPRIEKAVEITQAESTEQSAVAGHSGNPLRAIPLDISRADAVVTHGDRFDNPVRAEPQHDRMAMDDEATASHSESSSTSRETIEMNGAHQQAQRIKKATRKFMFSSSELASV